MSIDSEGRLNRAYQDICKNYSPCKSKDTGVVSVKSGKIYECNNFDRGGNVDRGCYWCINKDYEF